MQIKEFKENILEIVQHSDVSIKQIGFLAKYYDHENVSVIKKLMFEIQDQLSSFDLRGRGDKTSKLEEAQKPLLQLDEKIKALFTSYQSEHRESYNMDQLNEETKKYLKALDHLVKVKVSEITE